MNAPESELLGRWKQKTKKSKRQKAVGWMERIAIIAIFVGSWINLVLMLF